VPVIFDKITKVNAVQYVYQGFIFSKDDLIEHLIEEGYTKEFSKKLVSDLDE